MEHEQESRIRRLEFQQLIDRTERNSQRQTEERNRRIRTEWIAWLALLVGGAGLVLNLFDKLG